MIIDRVIENKITFRDNFTAMLLKLSLFKMVRITIIIYLVIYLQLEKLRVEVELLSDN